ncbi:MAG: hypothetical protein ACYS6W_18020 [Planctomycetota bacterium]|jgi:hypothetical protein
MLEDNSYRKGQIDEQLKNIEILLQDIKIQIEKTDHWRLEVTARLATGDQRFKSITNDIAYLKKRDLIIGGIAGGISGSMFIIGNVITKLLNL